MSRPRVDPGPLVGQAMIDEVAADMMRAAAILFARVFQAPLALRPTFTVTPGVGVEYHVEVSEKQTGRRTAKGPSPNGALRVLVEQLARELELRIRSDVGALELVGRPFDWSEATGKTVVEPREQEPLDVTQFATALQLKP